MKRALCIALLCLTAFACEREERRYRELPPATVRHHRERLVSLTPGQPTVDVRPRSPYWNNALGISEGKRLFTWYNCVGCHANGGGGMGPALMDDTWIYGSEPENIFATIVEGRPNGMPSFGGKIPDYQVWQLVAYIQSLSANVPKAAANGRPDDMQVRKQDQSLQRMKPGREPARHP